MRGKKETHVNTEVDCCCFSQREVVAKVERISLKNRGGQAKCLVFF